MKKGRLSLFCALLMLVSFSCAVSASIMVEDANGVTHYDTDEIVTTTQPSAFSVAARKALDGLSGFWRRFGAVTVIVLRLVAIVVAIVISEFERQKKESRPPQPSSKKKKK